MLLNKNISVLQNYVSTIAMVQSQSAGFIFENIVREKVFELPLEPNNTEIHDIPSELNIFDTSENVSIKTTGSNSIDCADILRIYDYDHSEKNTIIVIKYKQLEVSKKIINIYEIDFNREMHDLLFGSLTREALVEYDRSIKMIPFGMVPREKRKEYLATKKNIEKEFEMNIGIRPKVDNKKQRRVQCSIPKFETLLSNFIVSTSEDSIRGINIPTEIPSGRRLRNTATTTN